MRYRCFLYEMLFALACSEACRDFTYLKQNILLVANKKISNNVQVRQISSQIQLLQFY